MRADRLIRLLLILSDGRRRTVGQLAGALEVSPRTLFRDLDALELAGVPLLITRGAEGGVALPAGWTRLPAGLTAPEIELLVALSLPRGLSGVGLETALGKVAAALPAALRAHAAAARQRLLIDPSPWFGELAQLPALDALREAVWQDSRVWLRYRAADGRESERLVEPLALVVKGERVLLLADTPKGRRTFRVDRVLSAEPNGERFVRPADFELREAWQAMQREFLEGRPQYPVTLEADAPTRERLAEMRPAAERSKILGDEPLVVDFEREDIAVAQLALCGARVVAPEALQARLRGLAAAWG